jgi:hypothetical protein
MAGGEAMKWRDGVFAICPFCAAKRVAGDQREGGKILYYHRDREMVEKDCLRTRRHYYGCGAEIVEGWLDTKHGDPKCHSAATVVLACPTAMMTLSKGLTYLIQYHDLSTLCTFDQAELIAESCANVTALAIYRNVRKSALVQDNYRLPPIPMMDTHARILAEELAKR